MKLKYLSITPGSTVMKFTASLEDETSTISFGKKNSIIEKIVLIQTYIQGNPLSKPKYNDVMSFLFHDNLCYPRYLRICPMKM